MKTGKTGELSTGELRRAAGLVRESLLGSLPPPSRCEHKFSDGFTKKMDALLRRASIMRIVRRMEYAVAAILAVALLSSLMWVSFDTGARAGFNRWARGFYENSIIYRFYGEAVSNELPVYLLTDIPSGYKETEVINDESSSLTVYENGETGLVFYYYKMDAGAQTELLSEYERINVTVNGLPGDYYRSVDPAVTNELVWFDNDSGIVFQISSFFDMETAVKIAENIREIKNK